MALAVRKPQKEIVAWYKPAAPPSNPSNIAARAYTDAVTFFETELTQDECKREWIRKHSNMGDVLQAIDLAKKTYECKAEQNKKTRKWVDNFARTVTYYGGVLDVMVQYDPAHAGLAWGAIKFVFLGVLNHSQLVTELSKALAKIGEVLPRVQIDAALYNTPWMKEAMSRLYAYILLFLQKAVKWYTMGSARRAVSSILNPYSSGFQETVEEISRCTASIDSIASTSGRAEIRGLTLSLEESERKLHAMQVRMNELQASSDRTEAVVVQVLQVALNNHSLANAIKVDTADSRARIWDLQCSQILNVLVPNRSPNDVLLKCQSFSKRRPSWRQPGKDTTILIQKINDWVFMSKSSIFIVHAGARAESRAKDLVVELTGLLKTTPHPVFWQLSESSTSHGSHSLTTVLRSLIFQVLHYDPSIISQDPQLGNIRVFEAEHTPTEWISLAAKIVSRIKECFMIIEIGGVQSGPGKNTAGSLQALQSFVELFDKVSGGPSVIKMLVVSYGHRLLLTSTGAQTSRMWAKLEPPLPASRRSTYQVPMRLRRGSTRYA